MILDESGRIPRSSCLEYPFPEFQFFEKLGIEKTSMIILHKSAKATTLSPWLLISIHVYSTNDLKKKEVSLSTSRMARLPQALSAERHVVSIPVIVKSAQLSDQIVTVDFELQKVFICVSFNHNFRYLK